ncbi:MAG: hypothetical protein J6P44_03395 [Bacteroidales bacterium]|nr:hypothetical protein [Bacteroidales bacterium]
MPALTIERQQTDIIKSVLNIRNPEVLKDLRSYIKKKDKQETPKDDTLMTKEEFFAMIDRRMEEYEKGNYITFDSPEEMEQYFNSL